MRTKKKQLVREVAELQRRYATLARQNNAVIEILKASGIVELLQENEEVVAIVDTVFGESYKQYYKVNEVF
jgi:hypothetical protein